MNKQTEALEKDPGTDRFLRYAFLLQGFMTSGDQIGQSFASLYAIARGSAGFIQGVLVSVQQLGSAILQPLWGRLSDTFGRRLFIVIGFLVQALSWGILLPLAQDPYDILLVYIFQTLLGTMVIPVWNAWIGDNTEKSTRGETFGRIALYASFIALTVLATLSFVMQEIDPLRSFISTYILAFRIGGIFYALAALASIFLPQKTTFAKIGSRKREKRALKERYRDTIAYVRSLNPLFMRFLLVEAIFRIAWASAWPIFPYATLSATEGWVEIAILQIGMIIVTGVSQLYGGKLSDKIGRRKVILWTRLTLFIPPILYGLGVIYNDPIYLLISNVLIGLTFGAALVSINSLIIDLAPEGQNSSYFSIYIMLMGVVAFIASISTGAILDYFIGDIAPSNNQIVTLLFAIAGVRFITWFVFFLLPEV